jgi:hypothetical protein
MRARKGANETCRRFACMQYSCRGVYADTDVQDQGLGQADPMLGVVLWYTFEGHVPQASGQIPGVTNCNLTL